MKQSYREMIECITAVINEWDPYDLVRDGAPDDEFSQEVAQIAAKVSETKTPMELAEVISSVFAKGFAAEPYFSVNSCMPVASRLFSALQALGVIDKTPNNSAADGLR